MGNRNKNTHADGVLIAGWISLVGNQTSTAIAAHFQFEQHYTMLCLRSALLDGLLNKVRLGQQYLWVLPCDAKTMRDESALTLIIDKRIRRRIRASLSQPEAYLGDEPFIHSTVSAIGAAPIHIRVANSIFNMAAICTNTR